jgi:hypothetical protein
MPLHGGIIRGVTSPEGDNLVVFYYLSASKIGLIIQAMAYSY